jgi:glycosyltransferase involved in cell wall biosynthesis
MRIAVVTPLFPISTEPYRGQPIYLTVKALAAMAEVEAFYVAPRYPSFLLPRSYQYKIADPTWQPGGVRTTYLTYPSVPVLGRITNPAAGCAAVLDRLRRFRPDVILSYWLYPEGLAAVMAGRKLGVPVIVGSRGSDLLRIADGVTRRGTARALRQAAAAIVVSGELRREAISLGAPADRVHLVVNGCDRSVFHQGDRAAARAALGVDPSARLVLYVGHLLASKGLTELASAWSAVRAAVPHAALALIGEGAMRPTLAASPGINLLGPRPAREIAQWLAACDVFTLPSHSEGCPNVVIEALACGRPVVGTTVGAIPDLLDETSGLLVAPRDSEALQKALIRALHSNWDPSAIAAAHARSWQDAAAETLRVCEVVLPLPYRR